MFGLTQHGFQPAREVRITETAIPLKRGVQLLRRWGCFSRYNFYETSTNLILPCSRFLLDLAKSKRVLFSQAHFHSAFNT